MLFAKVLFEVDKARKQMHVWQGKNEPKNSGEVETSRKS
jgi:hypothetical protein